VARSSAFDMLIENTLMELESELEIGAEYDFVPPIPNLKWRVYTDDSPTGTWRLDREIPPRRMDPGQVRKFEEECLRKLAPNVGPLASRIAIQRCRWDGKKFSPDRVVSCRVIDVVTAQISTCTHPRPPDSC
jgi:hypothetical protein